MSLTHSRFKVSVSCMDGVANVTITAYFSHKADALDEAKRLAAKYEVHAHVLDQMAGTYGSRQGIDSYIDGNGAVVSAADMQRYWIEARAHAQEIRQGYMSAVVKRIFP